MIPLLVPVLIQVVYRTNTVVVPGMYPFITVVPVTKNCQKKAQIGGNYQGFAQFFDVIPTISVVPI